MKWIIRITVTLEFPRKPSQLYNKKMSKLNKVVENSFSMYSVNISELTHLLAKKSISLDSLLDCSGNAIVLQFYFFGLLTYKSVFKLF